MRRDELYHHGIKGMKWGVRRFQREDGSRTTAGLKRYQNADGRKYGIIDSFNRRRLSRSNERLQRDIDSFSQIRNGTKTKSGKQVLTRADVSGMVRSLRDRQNINNAKIKSIDNKYSGKPVTSRERLKRLNEKVSIGNASDRRRGEELADRAWRGEARSKSATTRMHKNARNRLNASNKELLKRTAKRVGASAAVGILGGGTLSALGYKKAGNSLARVAGAYGGYELGRGVKTAMANRLINEGYLAADRYNQRRRRKRNGGK